MKRLIFAAVAILAFAPFAAHAEGAVQDLTKGNLVNHDGKTTGEVVVEQRGNDLLIQVTAEGLTPGWHGIHIHGKGDCSDHAAFKSAGSHAAHAGEEHGFENTGKPVHMGDLPNIWAGVDGKAGAQFLKPGMKLRELMTPEGTAIVIHAKADDYKSQPAGDSGDRVACGVIASPYK